MKRLIYVLFAILGLSLTSCFAPKVQVTTDASTDKVVAKDAGTDKAPVATVKDAGTDKK
jgi:hypothetical protein